MTQQPNPCRACGLPNLPRWRALFTRGGDLFTWWEVYAAGPVEAVELARTIDGMGALVEVVQVDEVEGVEL